MGYSIRQDDLLVKVPKTKRKDLLAIFKQLKADEPKLGRGGSYSGGKKTESWYSFANGFEYSKDIPAMFEAFGYECREDDEFYIIDNFIADKMGQDDLLWQRIKPVVTKDSKCKFIGEDGGRLDFLD